MIALPSPFSCSPRFPLGTILATPGALEALQKSGESPATFLVRHMQCDWGEMSPDDVKLNEESLVDGSRLMSAYRSKLNCRLWIITEAADEHGDRCATTLLLASEY